MVIFFGEPVKCSFVSGRADRCLGSRSGGWSSVCKHAQQEDCRDEVWGDHCDTQTASDVLQRRGERGLGAEDKVMICLSMRSLYMVDRLEHSQAIPRIFTSSLDLDVSIYVAVARSG